MPVLCHAMLCCACYAMLCCIMLCGAVLCCAVLFYRQLQLQLRVQSSNIFASLCSGGRVRGLGWHWRGAGKDIKGVHGFFGALGAGVALEPPAPAEASSQVALRPSVAPCCPLLQSCETELQLCKRAQERCKALPEAVQRKLVERMVEARAPLALRPSLVGWLHCTSLLSGWVLPGWITCPFAWLSSVRGMARHGMRLRMAA